MNDLAAADPERVKELNARWEAWAQRAQVKPHPLNNFPGEDATKECKMMSFTRIGNAMSAFFSIFK